MKLLVLGLGGFLLAAAAVALLVVGPRNLLGMWRYDQRREGALRLGDVAPSPAVVPLDGGPPRPLLAAGPLERPLVLVFGSFT